MGEGLSAAEGLVAAAGVEGERYGDELVVLLGDSGARPAVGPADRLLADISAVRLGAPLRLDRCD